jgi:hypothetical protein
MPTSVTQIKRFSNYFNALVQAMAGRSDGESKQQAGERQGSSSAALRRMHVLGINRQGLRATVARRPCAGRACRRRYQYAWLCALGSSAARWRAPLRLALVRRAPTACRPQPRPPCRSLPKGHWGSADASYSRGSVPSARAALRSAITVGSSACLLGGEHPEVVAVELAQFVIAQMHAGVPQQVSARIGGILRAISPHNTRSRLQPSELRSRFCRWRKGGG